MAEAFLSPAIQVALEKLVSGDFLSFFRTTKLRDGLLLEQLKMTLNSLDKVIEDAEGKQYRDDRVKRWLDGLKDTVFMAEDLLDEIATEASRQKLQLQLHPTTGNLRNYISSIVINPFHERIESRIKELVDHLDFLEKQRERLGLKEGSASGSGIDAGMRAKVKRPPTTSLIDEAHTYGRDADKERMVKILLSQNVGANQQPMNVIAIVGMGGMGKTALARLVYEDNRMKDQFQHRAWVCISQEFDVIQATKAILQELECQPQNSDDLTIHQHDLVDKLKGKKLFLVLDDVWNQNRAIWNEFRAPFMRVAPGSKILITTRNEMVAKEVMSSAYAFPLKPLQEKDCWTLFANHAFNDQCHVKDPEFESIGREIVKKCGGLPLALKALGSLLHTKLSREDWKKILKSDIWDLSEDDSNIIPSLRLSYHYLPSNLKRCFVYCSIFPKNYVIDKNVLIQLWMAEGLLQSNHRGESIEVGNEIFNDLKSRSFFDPSKKGDNYFIMHDLLNDLAKSVMGKFCLQLEGDGVQDISWRARYLSITNGFKNEDVFMCHQLRSFLNLSYPLYFEVKIDMLCGLTRMRALSLNGCRNLRKLTNDIDNLKQLRYLDLSNTYIKKCPDSMCSMINLQTLKLNGCRNLRKLPSKFHKLINLQHLYLEGSGIRKMPGYIGKLQHLQTMPTFIVRENKGSELKELGALKYLKGTLIIVFELKNIIIDLKNVRAANLKEKHLDKLKLEFQGSIKRHKVLGEMEEQILKALEPKGSVTELRVEGYGGARFPDWFDGLHLPNVTCLVLGDCTKCVKLPTLGQLPSLERLYIWGSYGIKEIGEEFYGNGSSNVPFRSLSYLIFQGLREWKEWKICYAGDSFPCLEELHLIQCPNLTMSLPQRLPSLRKLKIDGCYNLKTSLPKASTIQSLVIRKCPKLIASHKDCGMHELLSLKELAVEDDFEGMESFPEEGLLPDNLHSLSFLRCSKLKRINYKGFLHLHSLTSLSFDSCPSMTFEDMPEDGLPTSLSHLHIRDLTLWDCPEVESLPKGGMLSSIQSLVIRTCPKLIASRKDWGMHELLSLKELEVSDYFEDVESFPEEGLLPPNLHSLSFRMCWKLKRINYRGFQHLHSLTSLSFEGCTSLSLEDMPEDGLPPSLSHLYIGYDCSLLEERCKRETGPDWPKISHIPRVTFWDDGRRI